MKLSPVQYGSRSSSTIPYHNRSVCLRVCVALVTTLTLGADLMPPLPKPAVIQKPVLHGGTTLMRLAQTKALPKPSVRALPFIYPANASQFPFWDVERSTNMVNWSSVVKNALWPPSTNGDLFVSNGGTNGAKCFWRLRGHKTFE